MSGAEWVKETVACGLTCTTLYHSPSVMRDLESAGQ